MATERQQKKRSAASFIEKQQKEALKKATEKNGESRKRLKDDYAKEQERIVSESSLALAFVELIYASRPKSRKHTVSDGEDLGMKALDAVRELKKLDGH